MAINSTKLLSGAAPVVPYDELTANRYEFVTLGQTEPSLGAGEANSVLTLGVGNARIWSNSLSISSINSSGNISAAYFFGNGSQLTGIDATSIQNGNSNVRVAANANVTVGISGISNVAVFSVDGLSVTGNISANYYFGNGRFLTGITAESVSAANLTGNTLSGNVLFSNLTTVGSLNSLSVVGTATVGNLSTDGTVSAIGNVYANYFLGNIACATGYNSNTIYNGTSNVLIATANGNITMSVNGTPNVVVITSDTLQTNNFSTSGNAIVGGDLVVNGNLTYVNVTDLNIEDPIIGLGRGPNNTPLTLDDGKDRGEQLWYYSGSEKSAFTGYDNSAGKLIAATDVTITNEIVSVNNYGSFVVGNLEGTSTSVTGNITGGNVRTVGEVTATGNVTGGNLITDGVIYGNTTISLSGNSVIIGKGSGNTDVTNTGIAIGTNAGVNQGNNAIAIGIEAGNTAQGTSAVAIGRFAGQINQSGFTVAIGIGAGANTQGTAGVAIGDSAGETTQGNDAVAIGVTAGNYQQGSRAVAIGRVAGTQDQGQDAVAVGTTAGQTSQGNLAVAIGNSAGRFNQGDYAIAIGDGAGNSAQSADAVAIGITAGANAQGPQTVAVGAGAGFDNQGSSAVAVGLNAGASAQSIRAVAVGSSAGFDNQGNNAVAMGYLAGSNFQGDNAVAIGTGAGQTSQPANSIIINAGAGNLNGINSGLYVNPVRNNVSNIANIMFYDIASKEITYANTVSLAGNVTANNINAASGVSATGNITGGNISTAGLGGNITGSGNINAGGYISAAGNIISGPGSFFIGNGSQLTGVAAASVNANALIGNTLSANVLFSSLTTVGTLSNLSVSGTTTSGNLLTGGTVSAVANVIAAVNLEGGNVLTDGIISATGNATAGNVLTGGIVSATSTVQGGNIVTAGDVTASGTITGGNIYTGGQISATSTITGGNIYTGGQISATSTITGGNLATAGTVTATGTVSGGNIATAGTVSATGNVTGGNIVTGGAVTASGNVIANYFFGNGSQLTGIDTNLIKNGDSNVRILTANGNISMDVNGTSNVVVVTQTGIDLTGALSVTGNITGQNLFTGGDVSAVGDVFANNVRTDNVISSGELGIFTGSNGNILIQPNGTGNIVLANTYINGLQLTPQQDSDAASKYYVDLVATTGLTYHEAVFVATTTDLATATGGTITYTQPNGASNGVGAQIATTGSFNLIDTANIQTVGTRVLVKNEGNAVLNGIYTWANATTIVRSTDADEYGADSAEQISVNDYFFVQSGSVNAGAAYVVDAPSGTITFGTSNITFAQFSASQTYFANTSAGLSLIGQTFNAKVDNNTTAFDLGGNISVKANANLTTPNIGVATGTSLSVTGNVDSGNVITSGQISAVGTLHAGNLHTSGTVTATGNVIGANVLTDGAVSATGNITSANNVSGANLFTAGQVSSAGNITAGAGSFFIGNGSQLTGVTATNVDAGALTGNTLSANVLFSSLTTVGTLTSLSVSGNTVTGNLATAGTVSATGSIQGGNVLTAGNISASGSLTGGNIFTGGVVSAVSTITGGNLATTGLVTATGNVDGGNIRTAGIISATGTGTFGNVIFGAGYISGTGNIYAGNILANISGNVTAPGNNTEVIFNDSGINNALPGFIFNKIGNVVTANGNINGANLFTGGQVSAVGSIITDANISLISNGSTRTITWEGSFPTYIEGTSGPGGVGYIYFRPGNNDGLKIIYGGETQVEANIASTNTNSGALRVLYGGVGVAGNINAGGNITGGNIFTAGAISATGNVTANYYFGNGSQLTGIDATSIQNGNSNVKVYANGNVAVSITGTANTVVFTPTGISATGNVTGNIILGTTAVFGSSFAPTTGATVTINATDSIRVPVGNIVQRPSGVTGMIRFNTTSGSLEVYNGTAWVSLDSTTFTLIADDQFAGDGSTVSFTLSTTQTTNSVIVSINGVVQIPGTAYTVSGTTLTFTEAPQAGDDIDVRLLTTTTSVVSISNSPANAVISVSDTTNVISMTGVLSVTGNVYAPNFVNTSDVRLKSNITPITNAGSVVDGLQGVSYDWISGAGHAYGMIAQQVEEILPEAVSTDDNGIKSVNYNMVIPFLVETVKELRQDIAELKTLIKK